MMVRTCVCADEGSQAWSSVMHPRIVLAGQRIPEDLTDEPARHPIIRNFELEVALRLQGVCFDYVRSFRPSLDYEVLPFLIFGNVTERRADAVAGTAKNSSSVAIRVRPLPFVRPPEDWVLRDIGEAFVARRASRKVLGRHLCTLLAVSAP